MSGNPRFQAGVPFLGRSFAGQALPSKSHSRPLGTRGRGFKSLPSPSAPLRTRPFPSLPGPPAGPDSAASSPRLPPRRPGSRPSPLAPPRGRRGAAVAPSAVEASGAAVCGGHFAEEPGAEGMQMRQTQGGEPRSPEETGGRALGRGDGCLPRGREEGRRGARGAGCGSLGRVGQVWSPGCLWDWGAVGTVGP